MYFGHVTSRKKLDNLVTPGKFEEEKAKGRLRRQYPDGLTA